MPISIGRTPPTSEEARRSQREVRKIVEGMPKYRARRRRGTGPEPRKAKAPRKRLWPD